MVLKIERSADGNCIILRLSGRMQVEHLAALNSEMEGIAEIVLDLEEVKLVDREAVCFLANCEASGTRLRHCSSYIRNWITKERNTPELN